MWRKKKTEIKNIPIKSTTIRNIAFLDKYASYVYNLHCDSQH